MRTIIDIQSTNRNPPRRHGIEPFNWLEYQSKPILSYPIYKFFKTSWQLVKRDIYDVKQVQVLIHRLKGFSDANVGGIRAR